jgi:hypothetical protein
MRDCKFRLNGKPMSQFVIGASAFPAFSGLNEHANKAAYMCVANSGALPLGKHHIVDRVSGGRLSWLRDLAKGQWFALYAADGKVDDETFCNGVKRGNFRLHPKSGRGVSQGCITLDNATDFGIVRNMLLASPPETIDGTEILRYGTVNVTL